MSEKPLHPLALYTTALSLRHDTGPTHPEHYERIKTLLTLFKTEPFAQTPLIEHNSPIETDLLFQVHPPRYLDALLDALPEEDAGYSSVLSDTVLCPCSVDAALTAAGAACRAVDDLIAGFCQHAFCAVRPPGHHAEKQSPMGFCLFSTAILAATHAHTLHGCQKIAILDFDVHYGNGTSSLAADRPWIFFASTHQMPLFPHSGTIKDSPDPARILHRPYAPHASFETVLALWEQDILPQMSLFAPDLVILSAGFDAHRDDPLSEQSFSSADFGTLTQKIVEHCKGCNILSVLEGGYHLQALQESVSYHLQALQATNPTT